MELQDKELLRYSRQLSLNEIGTDGQLKLKKAAVLCIGAGGLGCPLLQYLAAAGVGEIGIIDFDLVEASNLQRQVLYHTEHIGKHKALIAKQQLEKLNPHVNIKAFPDELNAENALELVQAYDIIVDGSDNLSTRYLVNDASILKNKPLVYGAIYRFEGQVAVFNHQEGPSYRCLFPESSSASMAPNCSETGVLGVLPGMVGTYMANEVLKLILCIGQSLSGQLLLLNALTNSSSLMQVERREEQIEKVKQSGIVNAPELADCKNNSIEQISVEALKAQLEQGVSFQFLDVREADEFPKPEPLKGQAIPLAQLSELNEIDPGKPLVVYCQSGIRSRKAIELLSKTNSQLSILNLEGGINAWISHESKKELV